MKRHVARGRDEAAGVRRRGAQDALLALLCGVGLLLLAGGYLWLLGGSSPTQQAAIGGRFALTASDGQAVTDHDFRGRYLLVYFGYTNCRDVCPLTLDTIGGALDRLGARAGRVQPLFITVDPERDTPAALRRYLAGFTPRLIGLTGTPQQLRQVEQAYRARSLIHPPRSGAVGYAVDHSSVLYLIGPDGQFLAPIPADASGTEMAADIAGHLTS